ncbi:hypothetical protein B7P43_G00591 [Cryptotermes secundus]|uniref:Uracil-DNA glycosylase-like domain-containing protein n=1 Tax=Cryptotermes secundus TaxID=105785 RepID=A0A2J7Q6E4_9NEOP|nr:hypothetical protein B7P43_G00591 [Cryptotermes secundus]
MANATEGSDTVSHRLLSIELQQCTRLSAILFSGPVEYIYNPLEYAYGMHSNFVHKFCTSTKQILFLGMNPGPWGMSQTGVPFGEVKIVQDWLKITGHIGRPQKEHPSRQVLGLECKRSEVSGRKFWGLFQNLCRDPDIFFQQAFVYNYCPLAFMTNSGKNITPTELKASERRLLNEICDKALHDVLLLLQVEMIVAIGKFAEARANSVVTGTELKGKIKVITLHYLLCNTSLCSKNRWLLV